MMQVFKCAEKDMNDKTECPRTKNMFAPSEAEQARVSCVSRRRVGRARDASLPKGTCSPRACP